MNCMRNVRVIDWQWASSSKVHRKVYFMESVKFLEMRDCGMLSSPDNDTNGV